MSVGWSSLAVSLVVNLSVCILVILSFNLTRLNKHAKRYYSAKRYLRLPFRYRPRPVSTSFFGWWCSLLRYTDEEICASAGMDALVVIRFLRLGLKFSIAVAIVCFVLVLPANWVGGKQVDCINLAVDEGYKIATARGCDVPRRVKLKFNSFDKTSMANIEPGSTLLWCHLLALYIISILAFKFLWQSQVAAVAWRVRYLTATRKSAESHTVMVQDVPGTRVGTFYGRIYENLDGHFGKLLPRAVKERAILLIEGSRNITTLGARAMQATGVDAVLKSISRDTIRSSRFLSKNTGQHTRGSSNTYLSRGDEARPPVKVRSFRATPLAGMTLPIRSLSPSPEAEVDRDREVERGSSHNVSHTHPLTVEMPSLHVLHTEMIEGLRTDFDTWAQAEEAIASGMSMQDIVEIEFKRTYPDGEIVNVSMANRDAYLEHLVNKYNKLKQKIEDMLDSWTIALKRKGKVKRKQVLIHPLTMGSVACEKWGTGPCRVDQVNLLDWQIQLQYALVKRAQDVVSSKPLEAATAFVTFASRVTQSQASTSLHYHTETFWTTSAAPAPLDIIWANVGMRKWERALRFVIAWALFALILFTFSIPVTALQAVLSVDTAKEIGITRWMFKYSFLRGILLGVIPGLALMMFLFFVPAILKLLNTFQGIPSHALLEFEVGRKHFAFLMIVVWLGTCLSSGLFDAAKTLANHPSDWLRHIGNRIPSNATFFLTYILLQALVTRPIVFLRIPGLMVYFVQSLFSGTERAKRRLWAKQYMDYGGDIPRHSLVMLLLLVFSVQQPFIALACIAYFVTNSIISRYQLLYVFREKYQSGGRFWPIIFDQMFTGLVTFQIVMAVLMVLKSFSFTALLFFPIVASAVFRVIIARHFDRPLETLSLHAAADLDRSEEQESESDRLAEEKEMMMHMDCDHIALGPIQKLYKPPCFCLSDTEHEKLLQELHDMVDSLDRAANIGPIQAVVLGMSDPPITPRISGGSTSHRPSPSPTNNASSAHTGALYVPMDFTAALDRDPDQNPLNYQPPSRFRSKHDVRRPRDNPHVDIDTLPVHREAPFLHREALPVQREALLLHVQSQAQDEPETAPEEHSSPFLYRDLPERSHRESTPVAHRAAVVPFLHKMREHSGEQRDTISERRAKNRPLQRPRSQDDSYEGANPIATTRDQRGPHRV